jgi:hypothetical protein
MLLYFALSRSSARRAPKGRDGAPPPSDLRGHSRLWNKRNGAFAPESWAPDGAAALPFVFRNVLPHHVAAAPLGIVSLVHG